MWSKRSWSKRLWRSYLRSAERMIKLFRIINATFLLGSTAVILVLISLFTPLFSQAVVYVLAHLPLPKMPPAAMSSTPTAYVVLCGGLTALIQAGFEIVQVEEPMLAAQPQWHNEFKDLQHRPPLLFIKAVKKN